MNQILFYSGLPFIGGKRADRLLGTARSCASFSVGNAIAWTDTSFHSCRSPRLSLLADHPFGNDYGSVGIGHAMVPPTHLPGLALGMPTSRIKLAGHRRDDLMLGHPCRFYLSCDVFVPEAMVGCLGLGPVANLIETLTTNVFSLFLVTI